MPYSIRKVGRKYCLYLKKGNKRLGCHDTKEGAESQRRAIEMRKHAARSLVLKGATGVIRTATFDNQERVVVPVIALVEGVIWPINAGAPEFVPAETLSMVPQGWNGRPVFAAIGHPVNEAGEQVSGNSPQQLENAIGTIFNATTDGKRLMMEAWLDPTKPAAQQVIERVNAGQPVEVSVGAFVVEESTKGMFGGKRYDSIWREIIPDHLALLPAGDEGACSVAMGCGIRAAKAANTITAEGKVVMEINEKFQAIVVKSLKGIEADPLKEILATDDNILVYETASGKFYRQGYKQNGEEITFDQERVEVEPVMYYEPVDIKVAKGARHSAADMARLQAMHDYTVELGAACATPKMASAHPCGCQDKAKEKTMARTKEQRADLVKVLRTKVDAKVIARLDALAKGSSDLIDAIISGIKEKLNLSDTAAADLANLEESTLVELAGMAAPEPPAPADDNADGKMTPPAPPAPPTANSAKPQTEEEFLAVAPQSIRDLVADAKAKEAARKDELVKVLKGAQTEYTEAELKTKPVKELERMARAFKANAKPVDFGVNAPRGDETTEQAPAPINVEERIKANRAKK